MARGFSAKIVVAIALVLVASEALFLLYAQTRSSPSMTGLVINPLVASPSPQARQPTPTPIRVVSFPVASASPSVQAVQAIGAIAVAPSPEPEASTSSNPEIYGILLTPYPLAAKIGWSTKPATNASIQWSKSGDTELFESSSELVASTHAFYLTGLKPATTYYYELESCAPSGGCATKTNAFTTAEELPTASPLVPVPSP